DWTGPAAASPDATPLGEAPAGEAPAGEAPAGEAPAGEAPFVELRFPETSVGEGAEGAPWVTATGGLPPATHPVKAKLGSGIYHLPGMMNYDRTKPDRFYRTAADAEADGLRAAKR
ncbi:MAG: hypothetical protein M3Z46_11885, partial [Actinomycetota bacterium]|nr:hypothetical protein [Actinomycetota bacterium]